MAINIRAKHSILIAGKALNIDDIRNYLQSGVRVIWFGNEQTNTVLKNTFPEFERYHFLELFVNKNNVIGLEVADGKIGANKASQLTILEKGDENFNLGQYKIEHSQNAPLIAVKAGAGSGKTYVMNNRILFLLHTVNDIKMKDILMVTFTNAATDSMRRKLIENIEAKFRLTGDARYLRWVEEASQISISTIHSFLKSLILEVGSVRGYGTNLRLTTMVAVKRKILHKIMEKRYGESNNYVINEFGMKYYELEKLALDFWKKIDNNGYSCAQIADMKWGNVHAPREKAFQETLKMIFEEVDDLYNEQKFNDNAISMSDIIHEFYQMANDPFVREYIKSKYKYMFCDEFQDSDDIQISTMASLVKIYDGSLFVVGDIKQGIYRFRGATESAFERIEGCISEEREEEVEQFKKGFTLSKNYRTSGQILEQLDQIFRNWGRRGYLRYVSSADPEENDVLRAQMHFNGIFKIDRLKYLGERNDYERRQKLIQLIKDIRMQIDEECKKACDKKEEELRNQSPQYVQKETEKIKKVYKEKTIMVLTRKNAELDKIEGWLEKADITHHIKREGTFYQSNAVKDFCMMIEAIQYYDEPMYLYNLCMTAYCYIPLDIEMIASLSGTNEVVRNYILSEIDNHFVCHGHTFSKLREQFYYRPVLSLLCEIIDERRPSIMHGIIRKAMLKDGNDENDIAQAIIDAKQYEADLQKLLQILADKFSNEATLLIDICRFIRSMMVTDHEEEQADISEDDEIGCVQGMTVHRSKGLEFSYVIMPFMDDPFFNDKRANLLFDRAKNKVGWFTEGTHKSQFYDELNAAEKNAVIKEETRLLYVAMTRVKEGLYCFKGNSNNIASPTTWSDLLP